MTARWMFAVAGVLSCGVAMGQDESDEWRFRASMYAYFPSIRGTKSFSTGASGDVDVDAHELVEHLDSAGMASLSIHRGQWNAFTDFVYLDAEGIDAGNIPLSPVTTARADLDLQGFAWTTAAGCSLTWPSWVHAEVFGGIRLLKVDSTLEYTYALGGSVQEGALEDSEYFWDGIAGVKARFDLDSRHAFFLPCYFDAGTGESALTWQAAAGLGWSTGRCDVFAFWRILDYEFESGSLEDLEFSGPALGVSFRW